MIDEPIPNTVGLSYKEAVGGSTSYRPRYRWTAKRDRALAGGQ